MRRLLEIFPEGVIIHSKSIDSNKSEYISNEQFETQIRDIHYKIDALKDVEVEFNKTNELLNKDEVFKTSLSELLSSHENVLNDMPVVEQNGVKIDCTKQDVWSEFERVRDKDNWVKKIFKLKSLKISWEGNENSYMHVFIDTTDVIRLQEAQNNIRWQKIMFASASHEFRTPLNAIINSYKFINVITDKLKDLLIPNSYENSSKSNLNLVKDFEKLNRFISMGSNSSVLLLSLIEDILDLSKMEAGSFSINISEFDLDEMLNEVYDIFNKQWIEKRIKLKIKIQNQLRNRAVISDQSRIKQILLNLVSNSYKFTFNGRIVINASLKRYDFEEFVEFCVEDTGIGIK